MFRKFLYYLDRVLTFFEDWTLLITVVAALSTLFVSVVTRYTITYTLTWPEELVREVIVYTTLVGTASAIKNRSLIRIDAFPNIFPWLKKPLDFIAYAMLGVFGVFVTYVGWELVKFQLRTKQATVILKIPQYLLYSIIPLMGVLIVCRLIHVITEDVTGKPIDKSVFEEKEA